MPEEESKRREAEHTLGELDKHLDDTMENQKGDIETDTEEVSEVVEITMKQLALKCIQR